MQSTNDEQQNGVFALIKGPAGSGKSVLSLSFPNVFVLDFDRKMPTIAKKHYPGKEFHWECFDDVFKVSDQLANWYHEGCPYETIVIDSITTASTVCLNSSAKVTGKTTLSMLQTPVRTKTGEVQSESIPIHFYNDEARFFEGYFLDMLRTLWARPGNPKHVLFIAHLVTVESSPELRTKVITKTRSIVTAGKKVAAFIPTRFDEEWICGYEMPDLGDTLTPEKRICITSAFGEDNARTAFNLPKRIDFTNKNFFDLISELDPNVTGSSDSVGATIKL